MIGIRCHLCRERFSWDIMKGYPTHCECCKQFIGIPADAPELATPYISTQQKRGNTDAIYRDMENKSVARAQMAAADAGVSASEMSHMKMTDMKDGLREGDSAAANSLTQTQKVMEAQSSFGGGNAKAMAIAASSGTRTGPLPNAGTNFIHNATDGLRAMHSKRNGPQSSMPGKGTRL